MCMLQPKRNIGFLIALIVLVASLACAASAAYRDGEILVRYKSGVHTTAMSSSSARIGTVMRTISDLRTNRLKLPKGVSVEQAIARIKQDPNVEYAGPNHIGHILSAPQKFSTDPIFVNGYLDQYVTYTYIPQWGLYNYPSRADIHAPEAWYITTGSPSVPIAILDTGVDYTHPDLASKIWTNPKEIAGNGIDDDHNGFIDDTMGWDFVNNDNDPMDDNVDPDTGLDLRHGTFVSSIAGAETKNDGTGIGMAGVAWGCPIVPVKVVDANGDALESDVAAGIDYAVNLGVKVINLSLGFIDSVGDQIPVLHDAVNNAWSRGAICICAAGNDGVLTDNLYPACYDTALAVGASNKSDQRCTAADFGGSGGSDYGPYVDVVAPGVDIVGATWLWDVLGDDSGYFDLPGTSAAAPFVSGVAALLWSAHPEWTNQQVFLQITRTADDIAPAGYDIYTGYGRVNAYRALTEIVQQVGTIPQAKNTSIGAVVSLKGVVLSTSSGEIANRLYVQNKDRSSGIMLYFAGSTPSGFSDGDFVDVSGSVGVTSAGEVAVMNATLTKRTDLTSAKPLPLGMTNRTVGGGAFGNQVGVVNQYSLPQTMATGLNNIGMLVRTSGTVQQVGPSWFYMDDGSQLDDGYGYTGIYVYVGSLQRPNVGKNAVITGISTCEFLSPSISIARRILRPRRQSDIIAL